MNVYDFDKTIYIGDATIDFFLFCIQKKPIILRRLPFQINAILNYKLKIIDKTEMKEKVYCFFKDLEDIDIYVSEFWEKYHYKICSWYINKHNANDVIISASPEFLLKPICIRLGVKHLIASLVDRTTGKYTGINCYGNEKVRRFAEVFGEVVIDEFYSDSYSDKPLAEISKKSFIVKKGKCSPWIV